MLGMHRDVTTRALRPPVDPLAAAVTALRVERATVRAERDQVRAVRAAVLAERAHVRAPLANTQAHLVAVATERQATRQELVDLKRRHVAPGAAPSRTPRPNHVGTRLGIVVRDDPDRPGLTTPKRFRPVTAARSAAPRLPAPAPPARG